MHRLQQHFVSSVHWEERTKKRGGRQKAEMQKAHAERERLTEREDMVDYDDYLERIYGNSSGEIL